MKISYILRRAIIIFLCLIAPISTFSKQIFMLKEQKELALFSCLARNYKAIGINVSEHDWSVFHPRYSSLMKKRNPEYDQKYDDFMKSNVDDLFKEELPIHAEVGKPPYTGIFAKCVTFYESKALLDFISKNPL